MNKKNIHSILHSHTTYNLKQNLVIKKQIPKAGVICSNPRRAERIATSCLSNVQLLKENNSAWPIDVYVGKYKNHDIFVAAVAVGAAGAAFAIQQLVAANARYIIRYGSNDDPNITKERLNEVIIVDKADNLYGLMQGSGAPEETWGKTLYASNELISAIQNEARKLSLDVKLAICHHVEDYAANAYPESASEYGKNVIAHFNKLELQESARMHSRDMETAALLYRAQLDNFHAATVLQNVLKLPHKNHRPYDGKLGEMAIEIEKKFCALIFSALTNLLNNKITNV